MSSNLSIQDDIRRLLQAYSENDCKVWHIGTDFYETWKRFHLDLRNKFGNRDFVWTKFRINCVSHLKEDNYYTFEINGKQIKPYVGNKPGWSLAGIRQFLQVGEALGVFALDHEKLGKIRTGHFLEGDLTIEFMNVLNDNFIKDFGATLLKVMQRALFSGVRHIRNLGYTIFLCLLQENKIVFTDSDLRIEKIANRSKNGKTRNKYLEFGSSEYLWYIGQCYSEKKTYVGAIKSVKQKYQFTDIIESLSRALSNSDTYFILSNETYDRSRRVIEEYFLRVDNKRMLLRKQIINQRLANKEEYCNDLENTFPEKWYTKDCEAAHIFDIWRIKKEIEETVNEAKQGWEEKVEKLIEDSYNPNNGILLLSQWHHYFDKNLFTFNSDGELIVLLESSEGDRMTPIDPMHNLSKVRIKRNILNEEMRKFLKGRA